MEIAYFLDSSGALHKRLKILRHTCVNFEETAQKLSAPLQLAKSLLTRPIIG